MFWYHRKTKHSYLSIRQNPHTLRWEEKPPIYKIYRGGYKKKILESSKREDDFLYHIAGLTAKKSYPGVEYFLRVNPSAGALYPNELYFQARGVDGIDDGIYHYEVYSGSIVLLSRISQDEGLEPYLGLKKAIKGYIFLISALYERSVWKYRERAFRYALLDAGHLLGSIEASALLKPHAVQMRYQIEREGLNRIFGFGEGEIFLSAASVGVPVRDQEVAAIDFVSADSDETKTGEMNDMIEEVYSDTMMLTGCKKETRAPGFSYDGTKLKKTIVERRSQRGFEGEYITRGQFNYIMEILRQPILSDCDEPVSIYTVVNRVIDMPMGLLYEGKYLKYGDFSQKAGYLSLEQYSLAAQSAVTFFLSSTGRNYQALYQKAGIIGHRVYIASNYIGIGCSGIGAYYDDEVSKFMDLGSEEMVLYALAVGK